ncbi:MAG: CpsD/CapB family tyrosine-protein kinase [Pseudomonadales bacterium]
MERIKQALDKARAERDEVDGRTANEGLRPGLASGARTTETEIQYSQTRVVQLNAATLRKNRVIYGAEDREGLTAYKMLRTQVLQRMVARDWNALGITSPGAGDGKTLTAINLAISLAREMHHTVLLVDLDLRNPCVSRYFGIEPEKGIDDYLLGRATLGEVMVNPGIERLVILPARAHVENSSELLAAPSMGQLVQELKTRYPTRIVLFDVPPVLASDDALAFTPHVDALLLVVRDAKTTSQELEHALHILQSVPLLGTVLNASSEKISTYY